jgi:hypothetical protein
MKFSAVCMTNMATTVAMNKELKKYSEEIIGTVEKLVSELAELACYSDCDDEWLANIIQLNRAVIQFCTVEIAGEPIS